MKTKTLLIIILSIFTYSSCALRSITSVFDYQENKIDEVEFDKLGKGKILIYNGAGWSHRMDNTARLNIWIDEEPMGQIRAREYAIIELENGMYDFKLLHIDLFKFKSLKRVEIDETVKVIRIEPTSFSNELTITNQLPVKFDKFKYVVNR